MNNNPLLILVTIAGGMYLAWLWWGDWRAAEAGRPNPGALPGAVGAPLRACVVAAVGALVLTGAETWGELRLGLSAEQSKMTVLFGVYSLVAAVVEEVIFRGFIVVEGRGKAARLAGAVAASVVFAGLHPFLWEWDGGLRLVWTAKGLFSTGAVLAASLWFYAMRFSARLNPKGSLLPCFAAHGAKNVAVIAIKAAQGFVTGWW